MTENMPKMTIREMGETLAVTRYVESWGAGGEMRAFMGDEPKAPPTALDRGAMLAFDVAITGERGFGSPSGVRKGDRDQLVDLLANGLRIAVVDERENGSDGRTDVDRARLVLVSMAMVQAMRDRADGLEPSELDNRHLEAMRRKSGLEASAFSRKDASAIGVGMADMVEGEEANRQVMAAVKRAMTPSRSEQVEDMLRMADATWPKVEAKAAVAPSSVAKGSLDASVTQAHLEREAADRASRGR